MALKDKSDKYGSNLSPVEYKEYSEIAKVAQNLLGRSLGQIASIGNLDGNGKGTIGLIIEEAGFHIAANNRQEPDFPYLDTDLKVTGYIKNKNGIRAKERLTITMINYMDEAGATFETSSFMKKARILFILTYQYIRFMNPENFIINHFNFFKFPKEDLKIIQDDWTAINRMIREGRAHELTEGMTLYLSACTKGASSRNLTVQPFSNIMAKPRAYALKKTYMNTVLVKYVIGKDLDIMSDESVERVIRYAEELDGKGLLGCITEKLSPYYGKPIKELKGMFHLDSTAKNINEMLLSRMLNLQGLVSHTAEFVNGQIIPKTIRIQKSGNIKESMSFKTFKAEDLIQENWELSTLREYLEPSKFMFAIFRENEGGEYVFEKVVFWNMPAEDLDEVQKVWQKTVNLLKNRQAVSYDDQGNKISNLPKSTENRVAHVRPHARNRADVDVLPGGETLTKQCFWLNRSYVKDVINSLL